MVVRAAEPAREKQKGPVLDTHGMSSSYSPSSSRDQLTWGCVIGAAAIILGVMLLVRLEQPPLEWFDADNKSKEATTKAPAPPPKPTASSSKTVHPNKKRVRVVAKPLPERFRTKIIRLQDKDAATAGK